MVVYSQNTTLDKIVIKGVHKKIGKFYDNYYFKFFLIGLNYQRSIIEKIRRFYGEHPLIVSLYFKHLFSAVKGGAPVNMSYMRAPVKKDVQLTS